MKEIYRSADPVMLSKVEHVLSCNEIESVRLDQYTSSMLGGFMPQRIMVHADLHNDAARVLRMEQIKPSSDAEGDKFRLFRKNPRPW